MGINVETITYPGNVHRFQNIEREREREKVGREGEPVTDTIFYFDLKHLTLRNIHKISEIQIPLQLNITHRLD